MANREWVTQVADYLKGLQDRICAGIEEVEATEPALEVELPTNAGILPNPDSAPARFESDVIDRDNGGLSRPRVLSNGKHLERAAVNFSHTVGKQLPATASARRPELAGRSFEAASVSLIMHPRNPYAPTSHANVRFFIAQKPGADPVWWFGGGFDLTPYYGFEEDAVHWHEQSKAACDPFGTETYPRLKKWCDEYFYLKHRNEPRGIGGLFFDDWSEGDFEQSFAFQRSVGDHFLSAYLPILKRRIHTPYTERERQFQLIRRGRYVEFNLVYDRGTLFGLQSGARIESILASMPPLVRWGYDEQPEAGTPEGKLLKEFITPRDWLGLEATPQ